MGMLVGTRHRHDNRLAMAILTRADRKADAYREGERLTIAVSEEFEELLDLIEAEGNAMAFIGSRRPAADDYRPQDQIPHADDERIHAYYERRPYAEGARIGDGIFDPYPGT